MKDLEQRTAEARTYHQQSMHRVDTTPEPENQKFPRGSRVSIAPDLGTAMSHFPKGVDATVEYTYGHAYGTDNVDSYSLNVDGYGSSAWYKESQLTATVSDPMPDVFLKSLTKPSMKEIQLPEKQLAAICMAQAGGGWNEDQVVDAMLKQQSIRAGKVLPVKAQGQEAQIYRKFKVTLLQTHEGRFRLTFTNGKPEQLENTTYTLGLSTPASHRKVEICALKTINKGLKPEDRIAPIQLQFVHE